MFRSLMTTRRFAPLFWCQFFSAFNDNFLKNALVFLILFKVAGRRGRGRPSGHPGDAGRCPSSSARSSSCRVSGVSSPTATTRRSSPSGLKFAEVFAAAAAAIGFFLHSVPVLFVALGLFGTVAALFGPIKYGIPARPP